MSSTEVALVVFGALAFTAIGSFVCVIIDRLPVYSQEPNEFGEHWDTRPWSEVLGGHSRCSSCGAPVRPWHNVPVVSWLVLRGRCSECGDRIPAFHPVVELLCPLLFVVAVWSLGWDWQILPALWLIPVGVAVSAIDLRTLIVPTRIVWPATALAVALSVVAALLDGEWAWLLSASVGVLTLAGPLFLLWFAMPAGMGFGDVRLAVLLGWTVGFYAGSRPAAAVILVLFLLAGAALMGIVVGVIALGARGRKAKVPFGPSLVAAAFLCIVFAPAILDPWAVYQLS